MQRCPNCGAELPEDARFCGKCGRIPPNNTPAFNAAPSSISPVKDDFSIDNSYAARRHTRQPYQYSPPPANAQQPSSSPFYNQNTNRAANSAPGTWQPGTYASAPPNGASLAEERSYQPYMAQAPAEVPPVFPVQPPPAGGQPRRGFFRRKAASGPRRRRGCMIGCLSVLVILVILGVILVPMAQKVLAFGSAISTQSPLSTQTGYMNTSSRVNILILGYGGAGHDGAYLTDSMVVMSLIPSSHHTTLISIPRDLWVQNPANSGNYTKINDVYPVYAGYNNTKPVAGGDAAAQKVSLITGLQINYWVTINFSGFKDFINAIGGVDVKVPDAFTAKYPANDDPSVNPNWITVHFSKGEQHMDGARAIIYARARYVLDNNAEGSDFARSQRQQLIMQAAFAKLKDWHNWLSIYNAMGTLQKTLYTNLSLADLAEFALHMDLTNAHRVGLSNDNVLTDANIDGQDTLVPRTSWQDIINYVQHGLYN